MERIKELLNDETNLFYHTLNSIFDGVYIVDKERKIVFWNKGAEQITGYTSKEVMGRCCGENILNHIDENGKQLCYDGCPILQVMSDGKPLIAKVYPLTKNGRRIPVQTHISPFYDENGEIIGSIEVFRDVSKEDRYRVLQEKFNKLIRRYVSAKTFSDIHSRLESEQQQAETRHLDMTVMYIDVVGFTKLTENLDARQVVKILNSLFGICDVVTKEFHGDIDKFIGDAVMAVFNDPKDAIKCSLKILGEGLPVLNKGFEEQGLESIAVRIGINSGIVIQGDVGNLDRKDLTVIGDAVNVAARIEKLAPNNKLLVSEMTLSRADKECFELFDFFGDVSIRGKMNRIKLYVNK